MPYLMKRDLSLLYEQEYQAVLTWGIFSSPEDNDASKVRGEQAY